jgi:transcriptional regulator with XRE-family HTH domain
MTETMERKVHQGRNVKRFREMLGMKQEALAQELGEDWTQKKISLLEAKEEIEPALLEQVAKALKVPGEAIKSFDDDAAINIISSTFNDHAIGYARYYSPTFNPIDKVVQLYDEKVELYERMLKDKNEMIDRLERLFSNIK